MSALDLDAIEAVCREGIAQHRSSGVGENTILALVAALRESRQQLETQTKVADTFKQCLTDTYRPHVDENKALRGLVAHYDPALRERDNTITRVWELLERRENATPDDWGLTYVYTSQLRAALDPQETP